MVFNNCNLSHLTLKDRALTQFLGRTVLSYLALWGHNLQEAVENMLGICPDPGAHQRSLLASVPVLVLIREYYWRLSSPSSSSEITFGFCPDPGSHQRSLLESVLILELIGDHSGQPLNPFCCNSIRKHSSSKLYSPLACHLFPLIRDWWTLLGTVPIPSARSLQGRWCVKCPASCLPVSGDGGPVHCQLADPPEREALVWQEGAQNSPPLHGHRGESVIIAA